MILLLTFILSYLGFASLALAMDRHCKQVCQRVPSQKMRLILRVIGFTALSAALLASITHMGWDVGMVFWFGLLTTAALSQVLVLTYWPDTARKSLNSGTLP